MKTSFEIIQKNKIDSKGKEFTQYNLVRYILGIPFYKKDFFDIYDKSIFISITAGISMIINFGLIFFNFMDYLFMNDTYYPMYGMIFNTISALYYYFVSTKTFKTISGAEDVIKHYLKMKNFKSSSESVLRYNIDTEKGIFEKETNLNNRVH